VALIDCPFSFSYPSFVARSPFDKSFFLVKSSSAEILALSIIFEILFFLGDQLGPCISVFMIF